MKHRAKPFRRFALPGVWAAMVFAAATPAGAEVLFRRIQVLEESAGRLDFRSAYSVPLIILEECASDPQGCRREVVFDEVLAIDFFLENRAERGAAGTEESRGSLSMALAFAPQDLAAFHEELRERLLALSAEAFVQEYAGLRPGNAPLEATLAARSREAIQLCFDNGAFRTGVMRHLRSVDEQGHEIDQGYQASYGAQPATTICEAMRRSAAGVTPASQRTLSTPARVVETTVTVEDALDVDTVEIASLTHRPPEARFFKRQMQSSGSGSSLGVRESVVTAQRLTGPWRFEAILEPASIPTEGLYRNAWIQRWVVRTVDRRFGIRPEERATAPAATTLVAYLATVPPSPVEEGEAGVGSPNPPFPRETSVPTAKAPAAIDRTAFLDAVAAGLEASISDPVASLTKILAAPPAGLISEGWIAVACKEDGTATYSLPPTEGTQRVTNADLFCAAAESLLDRAQP